MFRNNETSFWKLSVTRTIAQIGMENPLEDDYYSAIGAFNLNDPTALVSQEL